MYWDDYDPYAKDDFTKIDPLFEMMTIQAIHELDWVDISKAKLAARRDELGLPVYKPRLRKPKHSTAEITRMINNMGGINHAN